MTPRADSRRPAALRARPQQPIRLEVHYTPRPNERRHLGSLAIADGLPVFECSSDWINEPLPLAPHTLTPRRGLIAGPDRMPQRLHGLFADSLPDAWGHVLADRHFARIGLLREQVTMLDRLAFVGTRGMGALTYEPIIEGPVDEFTPDLDALSVEAENVLSGTPVEVLPELIAAAGASGGARPKVLVGIAPSGEMVAGAGEVPAGYSPYLVKLASSRDGVDAPAVEYAYARLAAAAGLRIGEARLLKGEHERHFATPRFDRGDGGARIHALTLSGLMDVEREYFAMEYGAVGAMIVRTCEDFGEGAEFARRMVFNVLTHNRDDHLKNTALLMSADGIWELSPAYDLVPMAGPGGEHSMLIDGEGRAPTQSHLYRAGEAMGVERKRMTEIISQVDAAVARWAEFADEATIREARRREVGLLLATTRRTVFEER